jgi:NAD(P)-dependent dehydrogenase (short-subunit alcohol dehydrogenase family)
MVKAGGGSIVNISSVAGLTGSRRGSAYPASKSVVRIITKSTAIQHAREGIRCNSIHPALTETDMAEDWFFNDSEVKERYLAEIPLGRFGRPEDVAYAALYLASDESSFVTGAELLVDGGRTAQ